MSTKRVEAAQKAYQGWRTKYQPKSYENSAENREVLRQLDEKFVWTFFADAEPQHVSSGFWEKSGWSFYVSEVPWDGKAGAEVYDAMVRDTCDECSGPDSDCYECEGSGEKVYFVD